MIKYLILIGVLLAKPAYAYIDPATGNAFFTLAITIVSSVLYIITYLYEHLFIFKGYFKKNKNKIPLLLYSEGNQYWNFFEPILDELEKRQIVTEFYTSDKNDKCFEKKYSYIRPTFIGKGNKAYAKMAFVKADIVLMTTTGLDVFQLKRSKYVKKYVHFYHGFGDHCGYKLFGADYYDVLLIDNEINGKYIREIEQKRNLPAKELVIVGNILLDKLQKKAEKLLDSKNKEKTILLSPSWGRESVLYQCGDELIDKLLKTSYNIIIRPHHQTKIDNPSLLEHLQLKYPESKKIHWDFDLDNISSMSKSDIMISDFSGIIYEYAFIFKRPVIAFNQNINLEQYDASDLRGITWKYTICDKIGMQVSKNDVNNINKIINEVTKKADYLTISKEINKYWTNSDKCVKNIVDYLQLCLQNEDNNIVKNERPNK